MTCYIKNQTKKQFQFRALKTVADFDVELSNINWLNIQLY